MEIASLATGVATAWLAKKAVEGIGLDLSKVASHVVDDVVNLVGPSLPANPKIGRNVNTKA
jgi:uncharacterized membrane protein (DUF441 family)